MTNLTTHTRASLPGCVLLTCALLTPGCKNDTSSEEPDVTDPSDAITSDIGGPDAPSDTGSIEQDTLAEDEEVGDGEVSTDASDDAEDTDTEDAPAYQAALDAFIATCEQEWVRACAAIFDPDCHEEMRLARASMAGIAEFDGGDPVLSEEACVTYSWVCEFVDETWSIVAGTARFDAEGASTCVAAMETETCQALLDGLESCDRDHWFPTQASGEPCMLNLDCIEEDETCLGEVFGYEPQDAVPGVCGVPPQEGDPCVFSDFDCAEGLTCAIDDPTPGTAGMECLREAAEGESCGAGSACGAYLTCNDAELCESTLIPEGGACRMSQECETISYCDAGICQAVD